MSKHTDLSPMSRRHQTNGSDGSRRRFRAGTCVLAALLLAAWISSSMAQQITPGRWLGGDPVNNDPFFACLNVSADGQRLTAQNTQCRGTQGQNTNSIDIQFQGGSIPDAAGGPTPGTRCNQYSYRNETFGDIAIEPDGSFSTQFKNAWINTAITGQFDAATQTVTGSARTRNDFIDCVVQWSATPQ